MTMKDNAYQYLIDHFARSVGNAAAANCALHALYDIVREDGHRQPIEMARKLAADALPPGWSKDRVDSTLSVLDRIACLPANTCEY